MHATHQAHLLVLHKQQTTGSRHPTAAPTFLEDELRGSHVTLPHHGQRIARHPRGQLPASRGASKTALAARRCRHQRRPAAGSLRSRAVAALRDGGGHGRGHSCGMVCTALLTHLGGCCEHGTSCSRPASGREAPSRHGLCTCEPRRLRPAGDGRCQRCHSMRSMPKGRSAALVGGRVWARAAGDSEAVAADLSSCQ